MFSTIFLKLKLYFEVKGIGIPGEEKAITAISELGMEDNDHFYGAYFGLIIGNGTDNIGYFVGRKPEDGYDDMAILSRCGECYEYYFRQECQSWACPLCGRSGDGFIDSEIELESIRQDWKHKQLKEQHNER